MGDAIVSPAPSPEELEDFRAMSIDDQVSHLCDHPELIPVFRDIVDPWMHPMTSDVLSFTPSIL